jgi:hypothetical protein
MENNKFSVDIIRDELLNYFMRVPVLNKDETDVNGVVWKRAVKRGPVHIYTGKRGMKLIKRRYRLVRSCRKVL